MSEPPGKPIYKLTQFIIIKKTETLSTKVYLVKAMVFPVVTCGCQSWTIKKAECRRIDAFELCGVGEDS